MPATMDIVVNLKWLWTLYYFCQELQSENFYSCEQGFPTLREDIHILDITWDTKLHRDIPSLFHLLEKIPLFVKVRYFGYPVWRDIVPKYMYVPFFL